MAPPYYEIIVQWLVSGALEIFCQMSTRNYGEAASDVSAGREQQAVNRSGRQKISAPRTGHKQKTPSGPIHRMAAK